MKITEQDKKEWKISAGPCHYSITDQKGYVVCDMRLPNDNGFPIVEIDSNADLIESAPNLLRSLKAALSIAKIRSDLMYKLYGIIVRIVFVLLISLSGSIEFIEYIGWCP